MSRPPPSAYKTRNWPAYNEVLRLRRGLHGAALRLAGERPVTLSLLVRSACRASNRARLGRAHSYVVACGRALAPVAPATPREYRGGVRCGVTCPRVATQEGAGIRLRSSPSGGAAAARPPPSSRLLPPSWDRQAGSGAGWPSGLAAPVNTCGHDKGGHQLGLGARVQAIESAVVLSRTIPFQFVRRELPPFGQGCRSGALPGVQNLGAQIGRDQVPQGGKLIERVVRHQTSRGQIQDDGERRSASPRLPKPRSGAGRGSWAAVPGPRWARSWPGDMRDAKVCSPTPWRINRAPRKSFRSRSCAAPGVRSSLTRDLPTPKTNNPTRQRWVECWDRCR
ncbi:hypothetical protein FHG71_21390 [Rubellimicrobium roseum]|uniref:Uncharacterized protein n=1 Tax=Rubellimicrobium roseum TaxID=687525 RepID=A0A5C4N3U7_9RHOB|nr:hypothetical protein FHG71_21390 [Rubellimicrobium roseum]